MTTACGLQGAASLSLCSSSTSLSLSHSFSGETLRKPRLSFKNRRTALSLDVSNSEHRVIRLHYFEIDPTFTEAAVLMFPLRQRQQNYANADSAAAAANEYG